MVTGILGRGTTQFGSMVFLSNFGGFFQVPAIKVTHFPDGEAPKVDWGLIKKTTKNHGDVAKIYSNPVPLNIRGEYVYIYIYTRVYI